MNANKTKLKAVAKILGAEFKEQYDHGDSIVLDGINFWVRYNHTPKQWSISVSVAGANKVYTNDISEGLTLSINVSNTKEAEKIAADIQKRLLPDASKYSLEVEQKLLKWNNYNTSVKANLDYVVKTLGDVRVHNESASLYFNADFYGEVQASSDGFSKIELRSVPMDVAEKIFNVLKEYSK